MDFNRKIHSIPCLVLNMDFNFSQDVVLISGGTGALGTVVTKLFVKYSPKAIVITYRSTDELENLKRELKVEYGDMIFENNKVEFEFEKTDVTREEEVENLLSLIIQKHSKITILVNVVGGYYGGKSIIDTKESDWNRMIDINLKSAFLLTKHVLHYMTRNHFGKIIHVSSITGLRSQGYDVAYASSKAGLIRLVESVANELKDTNININCVLPTIIDTKSNRLSMPGADFTKWIPPQDLSKLMLFLCSENARTINGAAIPLDCKS